MQAISQPQSKGSVIRVRKEVIGHYTADNALKCPEEDLLAVLDDWKKVKQNFRKVAVMVGQTFLADNPFLKHLFPSIANMNNSDLAKNERFMRHSHAVMRGLDSAFKNLSGAYDDDNEILPIIGFTHIKRGITRRTMKSLKESLCNACCDHLNSSKKRKHSWKVVLNLIFDEYLCKFYPDPNQEETETEAKKAKKKRASS